MNKNKKNLLSDTLSEKLLKLEKELVGTRDKLRMAQLDGDLSENGDWIILNEKMINLQKQILLLRQQLFLMKNEIKTEILITYRLLETGQEKSVKLTGQWDADPSQGKISVTSPLGLALVDKKIGEISEVMIKEKSYKVQIISTK